MKTRALRQVMALVMAATIGLGTAGVASARATRPRDFVGVWRLDARHGDAWGGPQGGWNDERGGWSDRDGRYDRGNQGRGPRRGDFGRLPETFRIDRDRRDFRVESLDGRMLRDLDAGRRGRDLTLVSERNLLGIRVVETYQLTGNGRQLVIHTVANSPRGTRESTQVYDRA